jgi:hypothetical protein
VGGRPPEIETQVAKLVATDGESNDFFGADVAVAGDGTTALVGAYGNDNRNGRRAGAAYVFERSMGDWRQTDKLVAGDGDPGDDFGSSVALSRDGRTALVGACLDDTSNGRSSGSASVFERSGDGWRQRSKLLAADGAPGNNFGCSVALSGDGRVALVGSSGDDDPNGLLSGSASVFERSSGPWRQVDTLVASEGAAGDHFGSSVALSDDGGLALVGAHRDDTANGPSSGSAYPFERTGDSWRQRRKLLAEKGATGDHFGRAVALSGDGRAALVGAYRDDTRRGLSSGSAVSFRRSGTDWLQTHTFVAGDGTTGDQFGRAVALSRDASTALVGAYRDDTANGEGTGSAHRFRRSNGTWDRGRKLFATDGGPGDVLGWSVDLSDDGGTALVGAYRGETARGRRRGAAYVFERSGGDDGRPRTTADFHIPVE